MSAKLVELTRPSYSCREHVFVVETHTDDGVDFDAEQQEIGQPSLSEVLQVSLCLSNRCDKLAEVNAAVPELVVARESDNVCSIESVVLGLHELEIAPGSRILNLGAWIEGSSEVQHELLRDVTQADAVRSYYVDAQLLTEGDRHISDLERG